MRRGLLSASAPGLCQGYRLGILLQKGVVNGAWKQDVTVVTVIFHLFSCIISSISLFDVPQRKSMVSTVTTVTRPVQTRVELLSLPSAPQQEKAGRPAPLPLSGHNWTKLDKVDHFCPLVAWTILEIKIPP